MVLIKNTNILVDDFESSKRNQIYKNYIYFLTHLHSGRVTRPLSRAEQQFQGGAYLLFQGHQEGAVEEISEAAGKNMFPVHERRAYHCS